MADADPSLAAAQAVADAVEREEGTLTPAKRRIVEMAVLAFAEQGYAATATRDIAERAGVSEAAIFRHFANKKDLLHRIVRPVAGRLIVPAALDELAEAVASEASIEGILRKMLTTRLAFARRFLPLVRIMVQEVPFDHELQAEIGKHVVKVRAELNQILQSRIADGDMRAVESDRLLRIVASLFLGYLLASSFSASTSHDDKLEIDIMAGLVARGLRQVG